MKQALFSLGSIAAKATPGLILQLLAAGLLFVSSKTPSIGVFFVASVLGLAGIILVPWRIFR